MQVQTIDNYLQPLNSYAYYGGAESHGIRIES